MLVSSLNVLRQLVGKLALMLTLQVMVQCVKSFERFHLGSCTSDLGSYDG